MQAWMKRIAGIGGVLALGLAAVAQEGEDPAPPAGEAPAGAPAGEKAPNQLAPADIPGITFTGNYTSFFTGVQYGTNAADVVYFIADLDRTTGGPSNLRHQESRLFVYQPAVHGKTKKPVILKLDTGEGGAIFKPYEVPVTINNWKGTAKLQFMRLNNRFSWTLVADLALAGPQGQRTRVTLLRTSIRGSQSKEDTKSIPLLSLPGEEKASITIQPDTVNRQLVADVRLGEWIVALPASNPLTITVIGENKMAADTMQIRADTRNLLDEKTPLWRAPLKRYKPGEYTMKSSLKIGPYGDAADEQPYSSVAPERGAPRRP